MAKVKSEEEKTGERLGKLLTEYGRINVSLLRPWTITRALTQVWISTITLARTALLLTSQITSLLSAVNTIHARVVEIEKVLTIKWEQESKEPPIQ